MLLLLLPSAIEIIGSSAYESPEPLTAAKYRNCIREFKVNRLRDPETQEGHPELTAKSQEASWRDSER